jgi:hypothetical protein
MAAQFQSMAPNSAGPSYGRGQNQQWTQPQQGSFNNAYGGGYQG